MYKKKEGELTFSLSLLLISSFVAYSFDRLSITAIGSSAPKT